MGEKIVIKNKKSDKKAKTYDDVKIKSLVDQFSRKSNDTFTLHKKEIEAEYSRDFACFKDVNVDINNNNGKVSKKLDFNSTLSNSKNKKPRNSQSDKKLIDRMSILEQKVFKLQIFCAFQLSNLKYSVNMVNSFGNLFNTDITTEKENLFGYDKNEDVKDKLSMRCEEEVIQSKAEADEENEFKFEKVKGKEDDEDSFTWQNSPEKAEEKKYEIDDPLDEGGESDGESNLSEKAMDIVKDLCKEMESENLLSPYKMSFSQEEDNINDENEVEEPKKNAKGRKRRKIAKSDNNNATDEMAKTENAFSESLDNIDESGLLNGEIPVCPKCDYKPVAKSVAGIKQSLKQHNKAVHDKIKDKECPSCEYKTSHKSNLNTHIKNKHKQKET